ncbi:MAG TPA: exonuclease domain-containing protein [Planctomycetota bacterium]|nr:exonuclease domain-containing protein [Planctomycetota bacterium]
MNFVAIDFETANPNLSSICQVGAVAYKDGVPVEELDTLINPDDYFDEMNTSIHGIREEDVAAAPLFPEVYESLRRLLTTQVAVCHTSFDRVAIRRAAEKHRLAPINCSWLDSASVVRRAWPQFARKGYGLKNVAKFLQIQFAHHNAKEDARASGQILLHAISQTGIAISEWLDKVKSPISPALSPRIISANSDAEDCIVFTGALVVPRREAAELAVKAGYAVGGAVNKETTILVVGDQDIGRLAGHEKSSKHRKAEEMIGKGHPLRIIGESDFLQLVKLEH